MFYEIEKIKYLYKFLPHRLTALSAVKINRGFKYEVQHGLKIHETPDVGF